MRISNIFNISTVKLRLQTCLLYLSIVLCQPMSKDLKMVSPSYLFKFKTKFFKASLRISHFTKISYYPRRCKISPENTSFTSVPIRNYDEKHDSIVLALGYLPNVINLFRSWQKLKIKLKIKTLKLKIICRKLKTKTRE